MKVCWTDNAISHLLDIHEYIAHDSAIYAKRMVDRIKSNQIDILAVVHSRQLLQKD